MGLSVSCIHSGAWTVNPSLRRFVRTRSDLGGCMRLKWPVQGGLLDLNGLGTLECSGCRLGARPMESGLGWRSGTFRLYFAGPVKGGISSLCIAVVHGLVAAGGCNTHR